MRRHLPCEEQKEGVMQWSVIICCHNSATRIRQTLWHLAQSIADPKQFELIIVDNASSDETGVLAQSILSETPLSFKIVHEARPGLVNARRAGVLSSSAALIAFVDDDNWMLPEYFAVAEGVFSKNPDIAVFGCSTRLPNDRSAADFIRPYLPTFAVGDQYPQSGMLLRGQHVWGAGMAIRSDVAKLIFSEDIPLLLKGRAGNIQLAGDDTEICFRAQLLGYKIWYECRVLLEHAIAEVRFKEEILVRMHEGFGLSALVLLRYRLFVVGQFFISRRLYLLLGSMKVAHDFFLLIKPLLLRQSLDVKIGLAKAKAKLKALWVNRELFEAQSRYFDTIVRGRDAEPL